MARRRKFFSVSRILFFISSITVLFSAWMVWEGVQFFIEEFPDVTALKKQYPHVKYMGPKRTPEVSLKSYPPSQWVNLSQVAREAYGAILVSEDWAFYQHRGFDANQIKEAIKEDWEAGSFVRGASTITQQVVKNVFLERDKNLWRKVKELVLAIRVEEKVGKKKILETYLNIAEWGEGIFGIGRASEFYFAKPPSLLTAREGAFLAMLLPSPKRYSQSFRDKKLTSYARKTIRSIMKKMVQAGYLLEEERIAQLATPFPFENESATSIASQKDDDNLENQENGQENNDEAEPKFDEASGMGQDQ